MQARAKAIGENYSFKLVYMLGVLRRAKDPVTVCQAPWTKATVKSVSLSHLRRLGQGHGQTGQLWWSLSAQAPLPSGDQQS